MKKPTTMQVRMPGVRGKVTVMRKGYAAYLRKVRKLQAFRNPGFGER